MKKKKQFWAEVMNYKNLSYQENINNENIKDETENLTVQGTNQDNVNEGIEFRRPIQSSNQEDALISVERLQEAVIWSEILDKPLCKRRKRRTAW